MRREFYAAGAAAETLCFGGYGHHGIKDDIEKLLALEATDHPLSDESVFDSYVEDVLRLLSFDDIIAVASPLEQRGYLSGHRIRSLLSVQ